MENQFQVRVTSEHGELLLDTAKLDTAALSPCSAVAEEEETKESSCGSACPPFSEAMLSPYDSAEKASPSLCSQRLQQLSAKNKLTPLIIPGTRRDKFRLVGSEDDIAASRSDGEEEGAGKNAARRTKRRLTRRLEIDLDEKEILTPTA